MVAAIVCNCFLQRLVCFPKEIKSLLENLHEIPGTHFIVKTSTSIITPNK